MLKYHFIFWDNRECRIIVEEPYRMLSDLSNGWLNSLEGVNTVIKNLLKLSTGELSCYSWGGADYCEIDSYKDKSTVFYEFGENEIEMVTDDLLKLMQDWKIYLETNLH
jgi:hypothetical protein